MLRTCTNAIASVVLRFRWVDPSSTAQAPDHCGPLSETHSSEGGEKGLLIPALSLSNLE